MKCKVNRTVCDCCGKTVEVDSELERFVASKTVGWITVQVEEVNRVHTSNFCSKECAIKGIVNT